MELSFQSLGPAGMESGASAKAPTVGQDFINLLASPDLCLQAQHSSQEVAELLPCGGTEIPRGASCVRGDPPQPLLHNVPSQGQGARSSSEVLAVPSRPPALRREFSP
jgi:hypothetical protein